MSTDPKFFEDLLLKFMYIDENVRDKVIPFITIELFDRKSNREIFTHINNFIEKYERFPTLNDSLLSLKDENNRTHLSDEIMTIDSDKYNDEHLLDELELFIKEKMISNVCCGTMVTLSEEDGVNKTNDSPDKLREAYSFTFDTKVGLDVFDDEERLFNHIHEKTHVIPTHLKQFNSLIKGGFHDKTLSLILGETNLGKSLIMTSIGVGCVLMNKKVLYVSCELSEESTGERVLANVFDMGLDDLEFLEKKNFHKLYTKYNEDFKNRFIIREYPAKTINTNSIRNLLKELKIKKNFVPDLVIVDQIENMNSNTKTKLDNTYSEMKKVTTEIRALAVEVALPFLSSIQVNRSGIGAVKLDLTNVGESLGFAQIADIVVGVTQPDEFKSIGKYIWEILKNRQGRKDVKLTVCVSYPKMRVYDDEESEFAECENMDRNTDAINNKQTDNAISMLNNMDKKEEEIQEKRVIDWD